MVIRNAPRAFIIALTPLALLHAALIANGIAGSLPGGAPLPPPDRVLFVFALRLFIDAGLLWIGHLLLRPAHLPSRGAYGIMGGIAAALGYAVAHYTEIRLASPTPGALVTAAILPVLAGMLAGFLYAQLAGREPVTTALTPPRPVSSSDVPVFALYSGPIQVRTSIGATAMTAVIPALIISVLTLGVLMPYLAGEIGAGPHPGPYTPYAAMLAFPAQVMMTTLFAMFIPSAIVVGTTHGLARSIGATHGWQYALIGAATGAAGSLLLVFLLHTGFALVLGALIGAMMGAVYRRFAGIEPLPLPEDVLATDPNALVAADHPSRRAHVVILNG